VTDILERLGLTRVINPTGTVTRLGASPIDAEVIAAMAAAARMNTSPRPVLDV
jgi:seryl-tRNA(Sec) selenium transferase